MDAKPEPEDVAAASETVVEAHLLGPEPDYPNNPRLPVLCYRKAVRLPGYGDAAKVVERLFSRNRWTGGWRDGVYNYHHYHSNAHEALGCYAGKATVQLGGP